MCQSLEIIREFVFYGKKNQVSLKLVEELNGLGNVVFRDVTELDFYNQLPLSTNTQFVFINLMDVEQDRLLHYLKSQLPTFYLIAIHCYNIKSMIDDTLSKGFDCYVPVFRFSKDIETVIEQLTGQGRNR